MPATQPTKEQIRAYMHTRGCARRPPPLPEEIRQQAGWRRADATVLPAAAPALLLPGAIFQLGTLMAVEWCFLAAGLRRPR